MQLGLVRNKKIEMLQLSSKAIELLSKKLELDYKEKEVIKYNFFEKQNDKQSKDAVKETNKTPTDKKKDTSGGLSKLSSIFEFTKNEKTILSDILSVFKSINQSFANVITLLMGGEVVAPEELDQDAVKIIDDSSNKKDKSKKSGGGGILEFVGLSLLAFSPAIIDYLKELGSDPEKIKETLSNVFNWLTTDLPNFFRNDLLPIINNFLDTEIIGSITGMDILKSAGIAAVLYAGKGLILKLLTKALFSSVGWLLRGVFGFLLSPLGLAALAAAGFASALVWAIKKIGSYGDEKRKKEAEEAATAELATQNKDSDDQTAIMKELFETKDALPDWVKKSAGGRSVLSGEVSKVLKDKKEKENFKKLDPNKKWKYIEKKLTPDQLRSIKGDTKTARELLDETKSETALVDSKVAQMFPDATMVLQDDYSTQAFGTSEQRKAAREALAKEGVNAEKEPEIVSAKEAELQAQPGLSKTPAANAIPIKDITAQTGGDKTTGQGSALSFMSNDQQQTGGINAEQVTAPPTPESPPAPTSSMIKPETSTPPASNLTGETINQASIEASKPKPPKPIIIPPSKNEQANRTMTKPGETWNINDVPDPTPNLGSLMSQLFVPDTNFSGAISI